MNKMKILFFFASVAILCAVFGYIHFFGNHREEQHHTLVGVIMTGSVHDAGFNGTHYAGIKQASDALGIEILLKENVKEYSGECEKVVKEFIDAGVKIIILGSFNYPDEMKQFIQDHPEIQFYCCSSFLKLPNYKSYFARVYQARYLAGIVAGLQTENNRIGYVAAMNNAEVNRGLNAFTLGVKSVNPKAKVYVAWTNSWDNAEKEIENVQKLVQKANIDLVTYHQNQTNVLDEAERQGIYSIGYNEMQNSYSEKVLTSVITNWSMVYKEILQDYLQQKNTESIDYWIGIEREAVGLAFYSPLVSDSVKAIVNDATQNMKKGIDVFYGKIVDNKGIKRSEKNEVIGDSFLRDSMDWFVDGIVFVE